MKEHEYILVFKGLYSKSKIKYFPIKEQRKGSGASRVKYRDSKTTSGEVSHRLPSLNKTSRDNLRYPSSIQYFNNREKERGLHPTQKPVALLEYLIKTYTNEGDTVLDNVMGSGSTGVACINTNRHFIGIEKEEKYYQIAKKRIEQLKNQVTIEDFLINNQQDEGRE